MEDRSKREFIEGMPVRVFLADYAIPPVCDTRNHASVDVVLSVRLEDMLCEARKAARAIRDAAEDA